MHSVYIQKLGKIGPMKKFSTQYLFLSPVVLCVDIVLSVAVYFVYIFLCLMSFSLLLFNL